VAEEPHHPHAEDQRHPRGGDLAQQLGQRAQVEAVIHGPHQGDGNAASHDACYLEGLKVTHQPQPHAGPKPKAKPCPPAGQHGQAAPQGSGFAMPPAAAGMVYGVGATGQRDNSRREKTGHHAGREEGRRQQ